MEVSGLMLDLLFAFGALLGTGIGYEIRIEIEKMRGRKEHGKTKNNEYV